MLNYDEAKDEPYTEMAHNLCGISPLKIDVRDICWEDEKFHMPLDFHSKINLWLLEATDTVFFSFSQLFDEDTGETEILEDMTLFYYYRSQMIFVDYDFCQPK